MGNLGHKNWRSVSYKPLTKRSLLAKVSQVFDPLGIFSPVTMKGRLLIQEAWKLKIEWDDPLPAPFTNCWKELECEMQLLPNLSVPRSTANESDICTLHIFCDASSKAYGAVAYLVTENSSKLITSKVRVAPVKNRTIPQLELTALLVGTKLGVHILQTLNHMIISETSLWSDNEVALQWIKNDCSKLPYVKNRVAEIQEIQKNFAFRHVGTKFNPADHLSRGLSLKEFANNNLWFTGPQWLTDPTQWPEQKSFVVSHVHDSQETQKIVRTSLILLWN